MALLVGTVVQECNKIIQGEGMPIIYAVQLFEGAQPYTEKDIDILLDGLREDIKSMDISDKIIITAKVMTEDKYNGMPDFEGP